VNAVALDGAGHMDEVFVDHGYKCDAMMRGERVKDLLERLDIVGAVVGRQCDAGEQYFDVRSFERREHVVEIAAGSVEGQAAQTVIAPELDDHYAGMQRKNAGKAGDSVGGGGSADAAIEHLVVIALGGEVACEKVGIRLAVLKAEPGGNAVTEADEDALIGGGDGSDRCEEKKDCGEQGAAEIHRDSVEGVRAEPQFLRLRRSQIMTCFAQDDSRWVEGDSSD
jgi:hypothetical protein